MDETLPETLPDPRRELLADVLIHHWRVHPPSGRCSCGVDVGLGRRYVDHPIDLILAGLDELDELDERDEQLRSIS